MPESIQEWAEFDYVGSRGPWIDESKFDFFENYKFYLRLLRQRKRIWLRPMTTIARWRLKRYYFGFPIEKWIYDRSKVSKKLS